MSSEFTAGRKFRVIKQGAAFSGLKPVLGGFSGYQRVLVVGEVIVCRGYRRGWGSDPGPDVVQWEEPDAAFVEFRPEVGGMWNGKPDESYLEVVDADQAAK